MLLEEVQWNLRFSGSMTLSTITDCSQFCLHISPAMKTTHSLLEPKKLQRTGHMLHGWPYTWSYKPPQLKSWQTHAAYTALNRDPNRVQQHPLAKFRSAGGLLALVVTRCSCWWHGMSHVWAACCCCGVQYDELSTPSPQKAYGSVYGVYSMNWL